MTGRLLFDADEPFVPDETCRICGTALADDPDEQPDPPLGPMCSECYRAREFDQMLWEEEFLGDG